MKYYLKFFENYEELLSRGKDFDNGFNSCENIESVVIKEKEFEYATMKIRFFDIYGGDNSMINFPKKYIKFAYSTDENRENLAVIFNGVFDNVSYVSEKYYDITYVAKPENDWGLSNKKVEILNKDRSGKGIENGKIYDGDLFLYCDKVTHEIESSNLKFDKNSVAIQNKNAVFFMKKNHNSYVVDGDNCAEVRILFQLARVKMWRENLFRNVSEKFDGETLSAESLLESVQKQLMFLKKPNVLIQKLLLKMFPHDFLSKKVDGQEVILKRSIIKGAILAFWWQYLIKKVDVCAKIGRFSHKDYDNVAPIQKFTVRIPFEELLDVDEWKANVLYNIKDWVFVQNSVMFCKKSHKSRHIFDDEERTFWCEVNSDVVYHGAKNDAISNIVRKITRVIENIKKYMLLCRRKETAVVNMNFEDAAILNVNNTLRLNDEKKGKIVEITHEISKKGAYSCMEVAIYHENFHCTDVKISDTAAKKILSEMTNVWNTNIHSSKHLIKDVKVRNSYQEQKKIIAKKYKTIADFERDFDRKRTKIRVLFNNIPPIIRVNYKINLGKL